MLLLLWSLVVGVGVVVVIVFEMCSCCVVSIVSVVCWFVFTCV